MSKNISTYEHDYYPRIDTKRLRLRPIQEAQHLKRKQSSVSDPISIRTKPVISINECLLHKPNRYLLNLPNNDHYLYKKLKKMTPNDVLRSKNFLERKSTYQIDYCRGKEWLEGVYL